MRGAILGVFIIRILACCSPSWGPPYLGKLPDGFRVSGLGFQGLREVKRGSWLLYTNNVQCYGVALNKFAFEWAMCAYVYISIRICILM